MKKSTYATGLMALAVLATTTSAFAFNANHTKPTFETLDNGVQITFEGLSAEMEAKIIERKTKLAEKRENIDLNIVDGEDNLVITLTTEDAETLEKLQNKKNRANRRFSEGRGIRSKLTKTVENLDNGVQVTITTEDAEALEKIQNSDRHEGKEKEGITVVKTNISNGVVMTITSEDAEQVEKIQNRAEKKQNRRSFKGKRGFRGGFQNGSLESVNQ